MLIILQLLFFLCGFTSVRKITWVVHFVKAKAARSQDQGQRFLSARCLWGWQGAWGRLGLGLGLGLAKNCLAYIAARLSLHRSMVQLDHFVCVLMLAPTSVATVCCCLFALKSSSLCQYCLGRSVTSSYGLSIFGVDLEVCERRLGLVWVLVVLHHCARPVLFARSPPARWHPVPIKLAGDNCDAEAYQFVSRRKDSFD